MQPGCKNGLAQDSQSQEVSKQAQRGGGRKVRAVLGWGACAILHSGKQSVRDI